LWRAALNVCCHTPASSQLLLLLLLLLVLRQCIAHGCCKEPLNAERGAVMRWLACLLFVITVCAPSMYFRFCTMAVLPLVALEPLCWVLAMLPCEHSWRTVAGVQLVLIM